MNKKLVNSARELVKEMTEEMFGCKAFIFAAPKELTRNFLWDKFTDKQQELIHDWRSSVRSEVNCAEKLHADKHGLSDHGDTYFEMLPLPAPNVIVMLDERLIRYQIEVFCHKKGIFISAVQAAVSEKGVGIAGINLSGKEHGLVQCVRQLTARDFLKHPIYLDRMSDWRGQLEDNTYWMTAPSAEQVAAAIQTTPMAVVCAIFTAEMAALMPLLQEDAKPFFYLALRLSENESVAQMQYEMLRNILGGFCFGRSDRQCALRLLEISLQEKKDIVTLEKVVGQPVLVRIDKEPVQREFTRAMQNRHCELLACGLATHPLQTMPILIGEALPAENAVFALDWPVFETVEPENITVLRKAFGSLLQHAERLADNISERITHHLALDGIPYEQAYLWAVAQVLDTALFRNTERAGTLVSWAQNLMAARENQQTERLRRFALAADIVRDVARYDELIASAAQEMQPEHLGFRYTDSNGGEFIAFELGEDFIKFITKRLGLRAGDSIEFRRHLVQNGLMKQVLKTARGRSRESVPHALICAENTCEVEE